VKTELLTLSLGGATLCYKFDQYKPRLHDATCCQSLTTGCIVYTADCQTGCTTRFDSRL